MVFPFEPDCMPDSVEVTPTFDQAVSSGPAWARQINPRSPARAKLAWPTTSEAVVSWVNIAWDQTFGVLSIEMPASYQLTGTWRMLRAPQITKLSPMAWAVSMDLEEVPE